MKTYGKHGRSRSIVTTQELNSQDFSDDEHHWDTFTSDGPSELITPKTSIDDSTADTVPKRLTTNFDKGSTVDLEIFGFLEDPPLKRRRRTRQSKAKADNEDTDCDTADTFFSSQAERSFQSTIDDANSMLSKIGGDQQSEKTEWIPFSQNSTSASNNESDLVSRVTYGNTRTIFQCNDEKETLSDSAESAQDAPECGQSTQHFNHLKSMGETLRYQDDLEFMLQSELDMTTSAKLSRMLSVALNLLNNPGLLQYVVKHCQKEVWRWSLDMSNSKDPVLLQLCAFVLDIVALGTENSLWGFLDFNSFILPLIQFDYISSKVHGNDHTKACYREFLDLTGSKPGAFYGFKLWNSSFDHQELLEHTTFQEITQLLKDDSVCTSQVLEIAEKALCKKVSGPICFLELFEVLCSLFSSYKENDCFIKVLVKVTNDITQVSGIAACEAAKILQRSLSFIFEHSSFLLYDTKDELMDVLILHLGLCLNLAQTCGVLEQAPETKISQKLYGVFQALHQSSDECSGRNFNQNMYILICCYLSHHQRFTFQPAERSFAQVRLRNFSEEIKVYNKCIYFSVQKVLEAKYV
ncbi:LANO_0A03950g1_1 [Lachancea nothofagi CBS 11611]|uniref:LANO_0A03950g1_1 n=1 Tax=Lachancea nothofagi CBS 11611 TaxID=1266666 RepID=A0A1G4IPV7_9SACH|nr:LANO_0A03950g1_1 [Lachancea nothofagi CBS 11611]